MKRRNTDFLLTCTKYASGVLFLNLPVFVLPLINLSNKQTFIISTTSLELDMHNTSNLWHQ